MQRVHSSHCFYNENTNIQTNISRPNANVGVCAKRDRRGEVSQTPQVCLFHFCDFGVKEADAPAHVLSRATQSDARGGNLKEVAGVGTTEVYIYTNKSNLVRIGIPYL